MNFKLTPEQEMVKTTVAEFAENVVKPRAADIDEKKEFPWDIVKQMGKMGLMGMTVSKEYGGAGTDRVSYTIALEEISKACGSTGITMEAHNSLGVGHIFAKGTEEQKEKYVVPLASGKKLGAWALTEPAAGTDAAATNTTAVLEGDEWVLNGSKCFITAGSIADIITVMAMTDKSKGSKGISAFIVEKGTPGLSYGKDEDKMGLRGTHTSELFFTDCRIPKENMLDAPGRGFIGAMQTLEGGRTAVASMAVGLGQAALEESIKYANERETFGKTIGNYQAVQWMIADMATDLEAARLLVRKAAWLEDQGEKFSKAAYMAKLFAATRSVQACLNAIQIHGGYGYTKDYPVERFFRDAKLCEIGEGTNEVQRMLIARYMLAGK